MTTISEEQSVVALINVFTVRPEMADQLIALLDQATVEVMTR